MSRLIRAAAVLAASCALAGCDWDSRAQVLAQGADPSATRAMQSRVFPTGDHSQMLHAVDDTVHGMRFTIDTSDATLGVVSATSEVTPDIHITIAIQPAGPGRTVVRVNGNRFGEAVSEAAEYQQFFSALEQNLSLRASNVP